METQTISVCDVRMEMASGGKGAPILFLHGGEGVAACAPVLEKLSGLGTVYAPSHPGFGRSELPAHIKSVDDLAFLYLELLEHLGLDGVTLVGCNFGGWIGAEIAVRSAARLERLVLANAVGARFATDETAVEVQDIFMMTPEVEARLAYADPGRWQPDVARMSDAELGVFTRDRENLVMYCWAPYMHSKLLSRWLRRIRLPSLVLWGEKDGIAPVAYGRSLAGALPNGSFKLIADAGHLPHVEQADEFVAILKSFLSQGGAEANAVAPGAKKKGAR